LVVSSQRWRQLSSPGLGLAGRTAISAPKAYDGAPRETAYQTQQPLLDHLRQQRALPNQLSRQLCDSTYGIMVELRKRKAPAEPAGEPTATKKSNPAKPAGGKPKGAASGGQEGSSVAANGTSSSNGKLAVGASITLEGFGGEIETNDGEKTTLKKLVDESKGGVVLFTYPKASTPGCMYTCPRRLLAPSNSTPSSLSRRSA